MDGLQWIAIVGTLALDTPWQVIGHCLHVFWRLAIPRCPPPPKGGPHPLLLSGLVYITRGIYNVGQIPPPPSPDIMAKAGLSQIELN